MQSLLSYFGEINVCMSSNSINVLNHHLVEKINVQLYENLSSSGVEQTEEEKRVTDALRCNDYPSGFTQKHTIASRRREGVEIERPKTTLTLPYIRGLPEAIRRVLTPLGVKVVF